MLKGKMTGGGGVTAKADKKEARVANKIDKKMGKLADKQLKQFSRSKDPIEGFYKSTDKFAKKADKLTQRYNKKK